MNDREKVIKGLECLTNENSYIKGLECFTNEDPYMSTIACDEKKCPYAGIPDCNLAIWHDALELLREQEPLVIRKEIVDEIYDYIAECPECGMTWAMWHPEKMCFCPGCGKAVKWDDSD